MTTLIKAVMRTLLLVAMLYGVVWGFRRLNSALERRFKRHFEKVEVRSQRFIQAEQIWAMLHGVLTLSRTLIILTLIYFFFNFVLSLFPWTREFARGLPHLILDPLKGIANAVFDYIPSLVFLILLFFITRYLLKLTRTFFLGVGSG